MKTTKKIMALVIAMVIVSAMAYTAFAASITIISTSNSGTTATETTEYTWYKIFDATIEDESAITVNSETGASTAATSGTNVPKVAYYVTTQAQANEIIETGLFNVVPDESTNPVAKWYVELKDKSTTAEQIATAFTAETFDLSLFTSGNFSQSTPGGSGSATGLDKGYYLIKSTLGDKIVLQTLADVVINTKNEYPGVDKTIPEIDKSAQIGTKVTYTIPVTVPATANDYIVITDEMTPGLTFDAITSVKVDSSDVAYTSVPATLNSGTVTGNSNKFTMTFSSGTVIENKGKTIEIIYTAILNENAVIDAADSQDEDDSSNDNKVKLDYGHHYTSIPHYVETDTQEFSFDKVDGSDSGTKLPGAVFELRLSGTALPLVKVEGTSGSSASADVYRIAMPGESGTTEITTTGKLVTIQGVDGDVTYKLVETKAPTGYNLADPASQDVKPSTDNLTLITIENNKGTVLPSTGGIGTTILYIAGAILVLGAGILLVTKRRMGN